MGDSCKQSYGLPKKWLVPSKLLVNPPEERLPGSSWPPRLPGSLLPAPEVSRSLTDTGPVPWLSEKSEDTRSLLSFSSENCPSGLPLSVCSRTPTCAPSTPRESPSCPRISSWPEESGASVLKLISTQYDSLNKVKVPSCIKKPNLFSLLCDIYVIVS